jgi:hypothetical protein
MLAAIFRRAKALRLIPKTKGGKKRKGQRKNKKRSKAKTKTNANAVGDGCAF